MGFPEQPVAAQWSGGSVAMEAPLWVTHASLHLTSGLRVVVLSDSNLDTPRSYSLARGKDVLRFCEIISCFLLSGVTLHPIKASWSLLKFWNRGLWPPMGSSNSTWESQNFWQGLKVSEGTAAKSLILNWTCNETELLAISSHITLHDFSVSLVLNTQHTPSGILHGPSQHQGCCWKHICPYFWLLFAMN